MVKEYGMSETLGLVARREDRNQAQFLGIPAAERGHSDETARLIDAEITRIIDTCYVRARQVLEEHRPTLERVVAVLFESEIMEGDELRRLLDEEVGAAGVGDGPPDPTPAANPPVPGDAVEPAPAQESSGEAAA
jgi:cell division protease FtsH